MNCEDIQECLADYVEGSLEREMSDRIRSHLENCDRCREEREGLSQTQKAVKDLPDVDLPPGFTGRVMSRIREGKQPSGFWLRNFPAIKVVLTVNAVALLVIGTLTVILQRGEQKQDQMEIAQSFSSEREGTSDEAEMGNRSLKSPPAEPVRSPEEKPQVFVEVETGIFEQKKEDRSEGDAGLPETNPGLVKQPPKPEVRQEKEADVPAKRLADFEILFHPKPAFKRGEDWYKNFENVINKVGGKMLTEHDDPMEKPLDIPKTGKIVFLSIPKDQFEAFKTELTAMGEIQSGTDGERPPSSAGFQKAPSFDRSGRMKDLEETHTLPSSDDSEDGNPTLRIKLVLQPRK